MVGVLEDDASIRRLLGEALRFSGHQTVMAYSGAEALRSLGTDSGVDVLVIDIGLPDSDGRDVCQALRSAGQNAPVLFLTAFGAVHDRLAGFGAGGDDYVAKPFELPELVARLEALGRRGRPRLSQTSGLDLDPARHAVRAPGGEALLTPTEFRMLAAITSRPDEVVRRRTVIAAAWPDGAVVAE
ncbi:MAG: tcrA, partial [Nocardioides sp.]|nr:tcrA [Nocardioides sp.]